MICMLAFSLVLGGCGGGGSQESEQEPSQSSDSGSEPAPLKAALLTSGPVNDGGWNTQAYEGLLMLKDELGYEIAFTENVQQADQANIMRDYAKKGFDLIIGHGFEFGDALVTVSAEYPDIKFFQVGGEVSGPNLASARFRTGELGYLAGKLAALVTKTNKIGFVGAMEIPTILGEVKSIMEVVPEINPNATVTTAYTGSWEDINKGKEAALAQIATGVDVIIGIGDACDAGAIQAVDEHEGVYFIGWSGDMNKLSPNRVLTSGVQSVQIMIKQVGEKVQNGTFEGVSEILGIPEGVQFLGTWSPETPEEAKAAVIEDENKLKSGEMVIEDATHNL
ncbi:MAG TPA: BMP family ABC transporter substrate-binding protein [Clostridia bacterium]|jgi:basic membrane protein A|nr:BMP family ABC transporter substrate-binding protein [Clostridia bacterium]